MDEEQASLDDHNKRVTDVIDRLQQHVLRPKEVVSPPGCLDPSNPLQKQLERIKKCIWMVIGTMKSLHPGEEGDQCLLSQLEEETVALKAELADTGCVIILLETGNQELLS